MIGRNLQFRRQSEPYSSVSLLVLSRIIVLFNFLFTSNLIYVLNYEQFGDNVVFHWFC